MHRFSVIPRQPHQIGIDAALLKLLLTLVEADCELSSVKDGPWAELTIKRNGRHIFEFSGPEELIEPLVDICDLWNRKKPEYCPPQIDRKQHAGALARRLLEEALCADGELPRWLRDFSLQDLAFALHLVQYQGCSLEDVGSLGND